MHVSPDDPMCETFFHYLNHHNMNLITHVGDERAVDLAGVNNHFGNPLLYEKWLIKFPNLKIIFAHVGSEGQSRNKQGDLKDNFELVLELMEQFPTQLYADLSAFSSVPARAKYLPRLLQRPDLFDRFIYGSDYPIPCILPLFKLNLFFLEYYKLLDHIENLSQFKTDLFELYQHNPLLSALILMKNMAYKQQHLPNKIFYQTIFNLLELDANPVLLKQIR